MINIVGSHDDPSKWKPKGFENYLTINELCQVVNRTRSRIQQLERQGRILAPIRVKIGRLSVRLYSPEDVEQLKHHFATVKSGRPRGGDNA